MAPVLGSNGGLFLLLQPAPGTEVDYLHPLLCTPLLSRWMVHGLGSFSSFHSPLGLLFLLALCKLEFISSYSHSLISQPHFLGQLNWRLHTEAKDFMYVCVYVY